MEDNIVAANAAMRRRLAADLEHALDRYGVDCRGLGYDAVASALLAGGWRRGELIALGDALPANVPYFARVHGNPKPRQGRAAELLAAEVAARLGFRLDDFKHLSNRGPMINAARTKVAARLARELDAPYTEIGEIVGRSREWVGRAVRGAA